MNEAWKTAEKMIEVRFNLANGLGQTKILVVGSATTNILKMVSRAGR